MRDEYLWMMRDGRHGEKVWLDQILTTDGNPNPCLTDTHRLLIAQACSIHQRYRNVPDLSLFGRFTKMKADLKALGEAVKARGHVTQFCATVYLWPESNYIDISIQYTTIANDSLHSIAISKLSPSQQASRQ